MRVGRPTSPAGLNVEFRATFTVQDVMRNVVVFGVSDQAGLDWRFELSGRSSTGGNRTSIANAPKA